MAEIKSYPLKSTYFGNDRLILSDMEPDAQGVILGTTKNITMSSLKSLIGDGDLVLTTTGTSGASTYNSTTNTLNIPNYTTTPAGSNTQVQYNNNGSFGGSNDFNYNDSTKILTIGDQDVNRGVVNIAGGSSGAGEIRLGDPGTSGGTVTIKGGNDHAASYTIKLPDDSPSANNKILESDASGNLTWINTPTGSVAQVTAATPAASTGAPLVVTPTTGNVTVQSRAYAGGSNIGHVPTGGSNTTFLRGDGNFSTVVTATPAFSPLPLYVASVATAISTQQMYLTQWYSTVEMKPTKIKLFFPNANSEDISIALYNGTLSPKDGSLYASIVNHNIGTTDGIQEITLTQESGVGNIVVGQAIALVVSIKGGGGGDTLLTSSGLQDDKIGQVSTTQSYISSSFPANINSLATGFAATKVRPAFFLY